MTAEERKEYMKNYREKNREILYAKNILSDKYYDILKNNRKRAGRKRAIEIKKSASMATANPRKRGIHDKIKDGLQRGLTVEEVVHETGAEISHVQSVIAAIERAKNLD